MAYGNFTISLGYKNVSKTYIVSNSTASNWTSSSISTRYFMEATFPLPAGSNYVLNSSSSSYGSPTISVVGNKTIGYSVNVIYSKNRIPFTVQEIQAIEASTVSFNVSYTGKEYDTYNNINMGRTRLYSYPETSGLSWTSSTPNYTYTATVTIPNSTSWKNPSVSSFTVNNVTYLIGKTCSASMGASGCVLTFSFISSRSMTAYALATVSVTATVSYASSESVGVRSNTPREDVIYLGSYIYSDDFDVNYDEVYGWFNNDSDRVVHAEGKFYIIDSDGRDNMVTIDEDIDAGDAMWVFNGSQEGYELVTIGLAIKFTATNALEYNYVYEY